ncbi:DUF2982 domain-containing protein [Aeromonas veronii]|nr:DUF2982 domain-containing protein [Aeromonas veronii]
METQHIKPLVRRNGLTLLLAGALIICLMLLLLWLLVEGPRLPAYILLLSGLMMALIGWLKLNEPPISLSLCQHALHYHHRYGGWALKWHNIQRIDQPRIHVGWALQPLPYIGFKIKQYDEFLALVTPRLAVHLLTEQRPLLLHALHNEQPQEPPVRSHDPLQGIDWLEESHFCSPQGQHYDGALAMLAQRMTRMRHLLGYDLLIPVSSLDREPDDFLKLLRQYRQASMVSSCSPADPHNG